MFNFSAIFLNNVHFFGDFPEQCPAQNGENREINEKIP